MTKYLLSFAAVLLLAGCGTDYAKIMGSAELGYTKAVMAADTLAQQPRCPAEPACIEQFAVDAMVEGAVAGDKALDKGWEILARFDGVEGSDEMIDAAVDAALSAAKLLGDLVLQFKKD